MFKKLFLFALLFSHSIYTMDPEPTCPVYMSIIYPATVLFGIAGTYVVHTRYSKGIASLAKKMSCGLEVEINDKYQTPDAVIKRFQSLQARRVGGQRTKLVKKN